MKANTAMKRLLLLLALLIAGSAHADWVKVSETDDATYYIDPTTIRKDGNLRKVWEIEDLKTRYKNGELSRRSRVEYDCKAERFRFINFSTHSQPMAIGVAIATGDYDRYESWTDIPPNTVSETIFKIVCAK